MQVINLEAQTREHLSKGQLNKMRREGWIPAILYDSDKASKNMLLKIPEKLFLKMVGPHRRSSAIVELKWDHEAINAVIKEIQTDIVSRKLLHIDFQKIKMTEKIEVMVPVHMVGDSPGVKLSGGILEHITRELKVVALPKDIPQHIPVDISALEIGQGIFVRDIKAPAGVDILSDPNHLIINIVAQKVEEEAPAVVAAAPTEPEVIAKGKKPEEGQEAQTSEKTPQDKSPKTSQEKSPPSK